MRTYKEQKEKKLEEVYCNCCGRKMKVKNQMIQEGIFHGEVVWGYFSNKDTEYHEFDLCEECYDKITANFAIPVRCKKEKELL